MQQEIITLEEVEWEGSVGAARGVVGWMAAKKGAGWGAARGVANSGEAKEEAD